MRTRTVLALAAWVVAMSVASHATTIVAVRQGDRVIVAADSAQTRGASDTGTFGACKVQTFGTLLVGISGPVSLPPMPGTTPNQPGRPAFDLHAIVKASVGNTGMLDVEQVRREASPAWAQILTSIKRVQPQHYAQAYVRPRAGNARGDHGTVAELLIVTAGRRPVVETVTFEFALPSASTNVSDVTITARRRTCPAYCHDGNWLAAIGMVEATRMVDGRVLRGAAEGAAQQRTMTPNDPSAIATAAVSGMVGLSDGRVARPIHLFEVGRGIRKLTNEKPCQ